MKKYVILKNGELMDFQPRELEDTINLVRMLEVGLDRLTQHSPYTIMPALNA